MSKEEDSNNVLAVALVIAAITIVIGVGFWLIK